jgi:putative aldouronate transport system permease protein
MVIAGREHRRSSISRKLYIHPKSIIFRSCLVTVMILIALMTLYPFIYTLSMSISKPIAAAQNSVRLLPIGFSLSSYRMVFENPEIWHSYLNTICYTTMGTAVNLVFTLAGAYALAQRPFAARRFLMIYVTITMFFTGGLIPLFIIVKRLGLYNTRLAMVLPVAVNAWYLIIARTYLQAIPESLQESAKIDGANDVVVLWHIVLPVSMPIVAVLTLFYAVNHWNSYFNALLFLPSMRLQPLQIYLQKVLILQTMEGLGSMEGGFERSIAATQLKYAVIIVTIMPILCVYPFLQKYFVKGIMIGSIKG